LPTFTLTCLDKPGALDLRMATREAHLAYLAGLGGAVKLGGPLLDADGAPCGSLLIVEAADLAGAQAVAAGDPYGQAGLFQSVEIRPFRVTIGAL
jgi:uncharacterized protein YciI